MDIEKIKAKLREKCNESEENKVILAENLNTPTEILEELCDSEDLKINGKLLGNEKVNGELREKAENARRKIERKVIETASELGFDTIETMSELIDNKYTSSETLTTMYNYVEEITDKILLGSFIPSDYNDEKMIYSEEEFEEFIDRKREQCRTAIRLNVLKSFIKNPNTPKEIIEKAIEDMNKEQIEEIYKNYYGIYDIRDAHDIIELIELEGKKEDEKQKAEELLKDWYDEDYNNIKEDGYFEDFNTMEYYAELAKNPNTPKEILEKIIELDFVDFSVELLSNSSLTYEMILRVAENDGYDIEDKDVACALARHKETPDDMIERLEESEHVEVLLALLEREERGKKFSEEVVLGALKAGVSNEDIALVEQTSNKEQKDKGEEIDE